MSPKTLSLRLSGIAVAAIALLNFGSVHLQAQTTACPILSSFEFPLWSDGLHWNQPQYYTSIQMADIDGDGQDELLGKGPSGIEVWHWDAPGQAWVQMSAATPPFGSTDILMTADVNGDGQAEIIQVTPNVGSSPVVNVWHYYPSPGVWNVQPQLRLTLSPSSISATYGSPATAVAPMIKFADMHASGRKELVYLLTQWSSSGTTYIPTVYQVNANGTAWAVVATAPATTPVLPQTYSGWLGGPRSFQIGQIGSEVFPSIVIQPTAPYSLLAFLNITAPTQPVGPLTFAAALQSTIPALPQPMLGPLAPFSVGAMVPNFAIGNIFGLDGIILTIPMGGSLQGYDFRGPILGLVPEGPTAGTASTTPSDASQYSTLQIAYTGLNSAAPAAPSVLILQPDGLDEFGVASNGVFPNAPAWAKISNTPFISEARFGDDPSHYLTIQTGKVNTTTGLPETVVVARDASGMHTLTPAAAGTICGSTLPGFQLPQTYYFPQFLTAGQSQAYAYINRALDTPDIREAYSNSDANLGTYLTNVKGLAWPANYPGSSPNSLFSMADFSAVQTQIEAELSAGSNAVTYFGITGNFISSVFASKTFALSTITNALNLPTDVSPGSSNLASVLEQLPLQIISSALFFIGNATLPEASQAAQLFSVIGTVIADVQEATASSPGSSLAAQTLSVETQITNLNNAAMTGNSNAQTKVLRNWDLMKELNQQINNGEIDQTEAALNAAQQQALTTFEIGIWQTLAPQVWAIAGFPPGGGPPQGYTYLSYPYGITINLPYVPNSTYCNYNTQVFVYPEIASTEGFFGPNSPVAQATIQQVTSLGVNYLDILGQRNGWQNIPTDLSNWCTTSPWTVPADAPATTTPPATSGAPATMTLAGGEPTKLISPYTCPGQNSPIVYTQSTPVNSVFPEPITIQVNDANANGVPNAVVQISGKGLSPVNSTALTGSNGSVSVPLLANGLVQGYQVTATVISTPSSTANPCLSAIYELQNTAAVSTSTGPTGLQPVAGVTAKSGAASDRTWTVSIQDTTLTALSMQMTTLKLTQTGGSACTPVAYGSNVPQSATPDNRGNFLFMPQWNFSTCKGLTTFSLQFAGTAVVGLAGGQTYTVPIAGTVGNQLP